MRAPVESAVVNPRREKGKPKVKEPSHPARATDTPVSGMRRSRVAAPSVGTQGGSPPKPTQSLVETPQTKKPKVENLPPPQVPHVEKKSPPILKAKPQRAGRGRSNPRITVYVARGGPARGTADYEQAFPNRHQALAFLSNQHGLTTEEQRQLAKASRLKLNRRWHGSEACVLRELALDADQAAKVLRGEATLA